MPDWLILILTLLGLAVGGAVVALVLHETAHAIVVGLAPNAKMTKFRPWPGFYRRRDGMEHWYNGLILYEGKLGGFEAAFHVAPIIKAGWLLTAWVLAGVLWWPLWVFALCELVDLLWWLRGYVWKRERSDGGKFRKMLEPQKQYTVGDAVLAGRRLGGALRERDRLQKKYEE